MSISVENLISPLLLIPNKRVDPVVYAFPTYRKSICCLEAVENVMFDSEMEINMR